MLPEIQPIPVIQEEPKVDENLIEVVDPKTGEITYVSLKTLFDQPYDGGYSW